MSQPEVLFDADSGRGGQDLEINLIFRVRVRVYCPKKNVQGYSVARLYQFKEQTKNDYKIIPSLPIPREIADGRLPLREIRRPSYRHCAP